MKSISSSCRLRAETLKSMNWKLKVWAPSYAKWWASAKPNLSNLWPINLCGISENIPISLPHFGFCFFMVHMWLLPNISSYEINVSQMKLNLPFYKFYQRDKLTVNCDIDLSIFRVLSREKDVHIHSRDGEILLSQFTTWQTFIEWLVYFLNIGVVKHVLNEWRHPVLVAQENISLVCHQASWNTNMIVCVLILLHNIVLLVWNVTNELI